MLQVMQQVKRIPASGHRSYKHRENRFDTVTLKMASGSCRLGLSMSKSTRKDAIPATVARSTGKSPPTPRLPAMPVFRYKEHTLVPGRPPVYQDCRFGSCRFNPVEDVPKSPVFLKRQDPTGVKLFCLCYRVWQTEGSASHRSVLPLAHRGGKP